MQIVNRVLDAFLAAGLWLALVLLLLMVVVGVVRMFLRPLRRRREQQAKSEDRCVNCGYDLSASPLPRCPECGRLRGFKATPEDLGIGPDEMRFKN